jgi:hypothetical protein
MRFRMLVVQVSALAVLLAPAVRAQAIGTPAGHPALIGSDRLGVSNPAPAAAPAPLAAMSSAGLRHRGPGVALMLVGGAGIVTGLLLDEGIITVAGAAVGLYGLYLYIR